MITTNIDDTELSTSDMEQRILYLELENYDKIFKKIESNKLSIVNNKHNNWEILDNGICIAFDRCLKGVLGKI